MGTGNQKEAQTTGYFVQLHQRQGSVNEDDLIYEYVNYIIHTTIYPTIPLKPLEYFFKNFFNETVIAAMLNVLSLNFNTVELL